MRAILSILLVPATFIILFSQSTFTANRQTPVEKYRTIDLTNAPKSDGFIQYLEYPKPGGDAYHVFLQKQKQQQQARFDQNGGIAMYPHNRSFTDPPELLNDFSANAYTAGIPLDNHLAVNNASQIVSVVNTHLVVLGPTGVWQEWHSLDDFWTELGETDRYFDPRVIYDPQEDRFVLTMMQDSRDCEASNIVFAFSATSDPTGEWYLYQFDGCPNGDATFADYPMISLTNDELFFTYNAVYQDSSWQTGFAQTLIYQINKHDGYAGDTLSWMSWQDVAHEGRLLRYIHPVKYATQDLGDEMYFLSNRSFDLENDTVFLAHINGTMDNPDLRLTVEPLASEVAYGVPPNAAQPVDFLQTNDARVLDAFLIDQHIQFVSNTMDPSTGRCAVFHGIIDNLDFAPSLQSNIVSGATEHYGYPGIAYTGLIPEDKEAIIIASHASADRFPGYSALFYNGEYSDWITVKEGLRVIDMIKVGNGFGADPTLERWGDYSGIQPVYNEEGTVYSVSSYGKPGNVNDSWIGYLSSPGIKAAVTKPRADDDVLNAFPNPGRDLVTFELHVEGNGNTIEARIFASDGTDLGAVFRKTISYDGPIRFFFDASQLSPGLYVMHVSVDGQATVSKQLIVQK